MNSNIARRMAYVAIGLLALLFVLAGVNLTRFSANSWFQEQLSFDASTLRSSITISEGLGTRLELTKVEYGNDDLYLTADNVVAEFNFLSILVGKPTLKNLALQAPYLELKSTTPNLDQLRRILRLAPLALSVTDGLIVSGSQEIQNIELSMFAGGVFGDYELQSFLTLVGETSEMTLGVSTTLSLSNDQTLAFSKATFDSRLTLPDWRGQLEGSVRKLKFDAVNDASVEFLTWTSAWQNTSGAIPYSIDWALGLQQGKQTGDLWQLESFDSALAYRDRDENGHTFAVQSGNSELRGDQFSGQIAVSILAEYRDGQPLQTLNLVMSGLIEHGQPLSDWRAPQMRLATISADGEPASHEFTMQELTLALDRDGWLMHDGNWQLTQGEVPAADFGFGDLAGSWPKLQLTEAPDIARRRVQPTLDLLAHDTEFLHALYQELVR